MEAASASLADEDPLSYARYPVETLLLVCALASQLCAPEAQPLPQGDGRASRHDDHGSDSGSVGRTRRAQLRQFLSLCASQTEFSLAVGHAAWQVGACGHR